MDTISVLDLKKEHAKIQEELDKQVIEVVHSTDYIKGQKVHEFEKAFASWLGISDVIGVGNGTDALQLAFLALGIGLGDEVIVPSFTYYASAEAIKIVGAEPVFVDVNPETYTIDPIALEGAISDKTKAIVAVHIYGSVCEMDNLLDIAKGHGLYIIEDSAQAIGATMEIDGQTYMAGTMGDIGTYSFFPSKNLGAMGDGGAVVCKDDTLRGKIRALANHGQYKRNTHQYIGMNSRLDSIQAAVLSVKLNHVKDKNNRRSEIANRYTSGLDGSHISVQSVLKNTNHVYHQYTIRVSEEIRDRLLEHLNDKGIPARLYYPKLVHQQEGMSNCKTMNLANSEKLNKTILSLPIHPELQDDQVEYIIQTVNQFFNG